MNETLFFLKGFSFFQPRGVLGCGSGNSAALPRGSEATGGRVPALAVCPFLALIGCFAKLVPLDTFPEGWRWISTPLFPAQGGIKGVSPRVTVPFSEGSVAMSPRLAAPPELPRVLGRMSPCPRLSFGIGVLVAIAQGTDAVSASLGTPQLPIPPAASPATP